LQLSHPQRHQDADHTGVEQLWHCGGGESAYHSSKLLSSPLDRLNTFRPAHCFIFDAKSALRRCEAVAVAQSVLLARQDGVIARRLL
jgi:hypothetical protein